MIGFLQNLIDALSLGSLYALAALGIGLMFGVLRLINFAHGDLITVGAYALIVPAADATARMFIGAWPLPLMLLARLRGRCRLRAADRSASLPPPAPRDRADPHDRLLCGGLHH